MKRALVFESEEALSAALFSELIPEPVQRTAARFARTADGLAVCPSVSIPNATRAELAAAGVGTTRVDEASLSEAMCWPALLMPRPDTSERAPDTALLYADGSAPLLTIAGELVRLGCERAGFQLLSDGGALLRVFDPPYYTLAGAGADAGYRVYGPAANGTDRVWLELGLAHPLADRVEPPPGRAVLIDGRGWSTIELDRWRDLFELVSIAVDAAPTHHAADARLEPIEVPLRLVRAARDAAPTMWVLRDDPAAALERIIAALPERVIDRLGFAVTTGDAPIVLLRARPSRRGPPALETGGLELAALAGVANLMAPPDVRVEPPLSRDRLRERLAADVDRIFWLTPSKDPGRFAIESVSADAFAPLADWVEYVIDAEARELETWVRSTRFELTPIAAAADRPARDRRRWGSWRHLSRPDAPAAPETAAEPAPDCDPGLEGADASEAARRLAAAERRFLESDEPLDGPGRPLMWLEIARLSAAARMTRAACGCFARALWEPGADPGAAGIWARAMPPPALVDDPSPDQVAGIVATVVAGLAGDALAPAVVGPWLDAHDRELDVRSIWLARLALAQSVGGDAVGLARARDRLLRRLEPGLSLARDIPPFLRFAQSGGDSAIAETLAARLEALLSRYRSTPRQRSANEAPEGRTAALVELEIAFGLASLGRLDRARELRAQNALGSGDPIDRFVRAAYFARIDQALEGRVGEPLGAEVAGMLEALDSFERYKVDRLRQGSGVLEPSARLDPMRAFSRGSAEMYGPEIAAIRASDDDAIGPEIDALLAGAPDEATLAGIFDLLGRLPVAEAAPRLESAIAASAARLAAAPAARTRLLTRALEVAGLLGRRAIAASLLESVRSAVGDLDAGQAAELAGDLGRSLRTLRRAGLTDSGLAIFLDLAERVEGWRGRGHVAAGLAFLGRGERAAELRERDLGQLDDPALSPAERLARIRALATAAGAAERDQAVGELERLAAQLPRITDSYNTNSHFCLSVVSFIDALVLGLASRDLVVGELGRRFRDTDEHLVRRRIHRDMEEMR